MKKLITLTLLINFMIAVTSCSIKKDSLEPLDVGTVAPDFTLQSSMGDEIKLSDFDNKVILLFFFGNSCPTCKAAAPSVESRLVIPYSSRTDYTVLGLDQWNGNSASVESFMKTTGVSFPLLLDASSIAAKYSTTYDRLIVIDKQGYIAFSGSQGAASDIGEVKEKIDTLLAG